MTPFPQPLYEEKIDFHITFEVRAEKKSAVLTSLGTTYVVV